MHLLIFHNWQWATSKERAQRVQMDSLLKKIKKKNGMQMDRRVCSHLTPCRKRKEERWLKCASSSDFTWWEEMAGKYTLLVKYCITPAPELGKRGMSTFNGFLCSYNFSKRGEKSGQSMNALDEPHHSGRLPSSPAFRRHAAMNGRSHRGDKKQRGGLLAMVCSQSHPLTVNRGEVTRRSAEDSGCLASRHTSTSKPSPNLTHNVGAQLPLVCRWPALYLLPSSWFPCIRLAVCEHQDRGGCSRLGTVPATASQVYLGWMQRAPGAGSLALVHRLRVAAARAGCWGWRRWSWTGWEPARRPVWCSLKLEDQKEGKSIVVWPRYSVCANAPRVDCRDMTGETTEDRVWSQSTQILLWPTEFRSNLSHQDYKTIFYPPKNFCLCGCFQPYATHSYFSFRSMKLFQPEDERSGVMAREAAQNNTVWSLKTCEGRMAGPDQN